MEMNVVPKGGIDMAKSRTRKAMAVAAVLVAACGGGGSDAPPELGAPPPLSVVVLGDSIASGEGINYGYTYYYSDFFPGHWEGGIVNPQWQGDYQLCHDSVYAYGDVLAPLIGATLTKFACTGSTYENGIAFDRRYGDVPYRPAQFGNWLGMTNLNAAYDAAKPDVVIITLGADDVSFADIFTFCMVGVTDAAEDAALAHAPDRSRQLRERYLKRFPNADAWRNRAPRATSSYCTQNNPGSAVLNLFWDPIKSGRLRGTTRAWWRRSRRAAKRPARSLKSSSPPTTSRFQDPSNRDRAKTWESSTTMRSTT